MTPYQTLRRALNAIEGAANEMLAKLLDQGRIIEENEREITRLKAEIMELRDESILLDSIEAMVESRGSVLLVGNPGGGIKARAFTIEEPEIEGRKREEA